MEKEYKISVKLKTMDMFSFLMRHEYSAFSGLFGLAVSILAAVALAFGVAEGERNAQILLGLVAACFTVINPLRLFFRAQKQITLNPTFHKPIEYTFREEGIHVTQGGQEMDVAWTDMKKLVTGKRIMILYLSRVVGYIFPKAQCGGNYEEISAMILEHMRLEKEAGLPQPAAEPLTEEEAAEPGMSEDGEPGGKRKWMMPPGEAEIWGEDEEKKDGTNGQQ